MKPLSILSTRRFASAFACVCALCAFFSSCSSDSELNALLEGQGENPDSGELVEINIGSATTIVYNSVETNGDQPQSRSNDPAEPQSDYLIDEYVGVPHFRPTRSGEDPDYEGPRIATMSVRADSASREVRTRAISMGSNIVFRVIVFVKNGRNYTFSSAADYKVSGNSAPKLLDSNKKLKVVQLGSTIRIVAFSENNSSALSQTMPSSYSWGSAISISKLERDFMTFDSGEQQVNSLTFSIPVSFSHQLAKLTVSMSATGFSSNTITSIGTATLPTYGTAGSWSIGNSTITSTNSNALTMPSFSTSSPYTSTCRVLPQSAKKVQVKFTAITVGGKALENTTITSDANLALQRGKTYTMTITFKKVPGINLPEDEINLGGTGCTASDKAALSKLRWAEGNLRSTGSSDYDWVDPSATGSAANGYYYTFYSTYTGDTSENNTDPCSKLKSSYGVGWKTPSVASLKMLVRCTDGRITTHKGVTGMWFINKPNGLFLPAAGARKEDEGSGTTPTWLLNERGYYWSTETFNSKECHRLHFYDRAVTVYQDDRTRGYTVRCVQGE